MTNRAIRKVRKGRLQMDTRFYMSSDLDENGRGILSTHEGRKVEIRYVPGAEDDTVWIFDPQTGRFLCDAFPVGNRTQDDVAATKKSQAVLRRTFTSSLEDALEIRSRLTEADLSTFMAYTDGHAPIAPKKSPSRRRSDARGRTKKQKNKAKLLTENTTGSHRATALGRAPATGTDLPHDARESA